MTCQRCGMNMQLMTNKMPVIFWLLLFCFSTALPAGGKKDTIVQVTGTVRLVGSSPLSEIVITGQNGQWYIDKEEAKKLINLQQRKVTVEGSEKVQKLTFANGLPAGERRTLSKITIIAVE